MRHLQATDMQLFVQLTLGTQNGRPLLDCEQTRQAVYVAVTAHIRSYFCHVLAISATDCQMGMVVSFPGSLSITDLIRIAHLAAQEAMVRSQRMMTGNFQELPVYWGPDFTARTLNAAEAAEAKAYLRQHFLDEPPAV